MTKKINIYFSLLFLSFFVFAFSKVSSTEIDNLFFSLKNANDASAAKKYEQKIWDHWLSSGSNKDNNILMTKGVTLMNICKLD